MNANPHPHANPDEMPILRALAWAAALGATIEVDALEDNVIVYRGDGDRVTFSRRTEEAPRALLDLLYEAAKARAAS